MKEKIGKLEKENRKSCVLLPRQKIIKVKENNNKFQVE